MPAILLTAFLPTVLHMPRNKATQAVAYSWGRFVFKYCDKLFEMAGTEKQVTLFSGGGPQWM